MNRAHVRPALPDDVELLATLQRTWWRDAYADLLPPSLLEADTEQLADAWAAQLAGAQAFIAEESTHPVGFALVDPRVTNGYASIEVLGVVPRWARRGHGGRLVVAAAQCLHEAGAEAGLWWVVESDETCGAFLAGIGWEPTGRRRMLDTGDREFAEVEYSGSLHLQLADD